MYDTNLFFMYDTNLFFLCMHQSCLFFMYGTNLFFMYDTNLFFVSFLYESFLTNLFFMYDFLCMTPISFFGMTPILHFFVCNYFLEVFMLSCFLFMKSAHAWARYPRCSPIVLIAARSHVIGVGVSTRN